MLMFSLAALILVALVLLFLVPPLWRARLEAVTDDTRSNVEIFRERLHELESDRDTGVLTAEQFGEARADLERELLADTATADKRPQARPARGTALALALLVPVVAAGLYFQIGGHETLLAPRQAAVPSDPEAQMAFIRDNLGRLQAAVEDDPLAVEPRLMLARSYRLLQQPEQALAVYDAALQELGDVPALLADYTELLVEAQDGRFSPQARDLVARALDQDPAHPKALWLAGLIAVQEGDRAQAESYWQRLLTTLPPESPTAAQVRQILSAVQAEAAPRAAPAAGGARVALDVSVAPELAERVPADATVFVLARAPEGGPPLAVQRMTVADLPTQIVLDESMAMVPEMNIGRFPEIVVEARVSLSGTAQAQAGDFRGRVEAVAVGEESDPEPIRVVIDEVVE